MRIATTDAMTTDPLAHRVLGAAMICGLLPKAPRLGSNVVVFVDDPALEGDDFAAASERVGEEGVVGLVVSSMSAFALSRKEPAVSTNDLDARDAYARVAAWAERARHRPLAPPVSAPRLRELVAHAEAAGLALVEPDLPSALKSARGRTAVERAVFGTIAFGATARPLLFVRRRRAPKSFAKLREERALDGWLAREGDDPLPNREAPAHGLVDAALTVLVHPMRGKDVLREARTQWVESARAQGERVVVSATDAATLGRALVVGWYEGTLPIAIFAADPSAPLPRRSP